MKQPLVSVCVPVRNGVDRVSFTLESLTKQTYELLEIIITENASDDGTVEVVDEWARRDSRIQVVHHTTPLTMIQNFRSGWELAAGDLFMWAADDDIFDLNWVQSLAFALERDEEAVVAFGDFGVYEDLSDLQNRERIVKMKHDFNPRGIPVWRRLLMDKQGPYSVRGLFRRDVLENYEWWDHTVSPDFPLFTHVLVQGEFVHVPGTMLVMPNTSETGEERAAVQSFRAIETYPTWRLSWRCAQASVAGARRRGQRRFVTVDFVLVLFGLLWMNRRHLVRWQLAGMREKGGGRHHRVKN